MPVFVLQLIPIIGIVLMCMLAMVWSVLLVNAGMIGIAVEAAARLPIRAEQQARREEKSGRARRINLD